MTLPRKQTQSARVTLTLVDRAKKHYSVIVTAYGYDLFVNETKHVMLKCAPEGQARVYARAVKATLRLAGVEILKDKTL